ncbi:MAG: Asp-tRNA(Asn)/Glu-tRNA(Gln) amidotransferase subunit GatB [Phycisphaerae bacterium]
MSAADPIPTIGMEVHLHLATRTKMFCGCEVRYDAPPNTCVCPVCLGMPGVLPVMNQVAVELAVRMALGLGCRIPDFAKWDRKHYYYPDLPKNYQISEYDEPLGVGGHLDVELEGETFRVGITRVHLEEDAGKLVHAEDGSNVSVVDLNRTGTPLLEIVSEPDIHSAAQARAYGEALRQLAVYLGVGHCNMQLGQMRFEPNISLRIGEDAGGAPRYTPITEIKNLNSFRSVARAVDFEIRRHRDELAADPDGYTLENLGKSTRGWNDDRGTSFLQRSKEEAHDYRYFPEPDLVPVRPYELLENGASLIDKVKEDMPESQEKKRQHYMSMGLSREQANIFLQEEDLGECYEKLLGCLDDLRTPLTWGTDGRDLQVARNWIEQDVRRALNEERARSGQDVRLSDLEHFSEERLAELIILVEQGTTSREVGSRVFDRMLETGNPPDQIIKEENLAQTSDAGQLEALVDEVIAENPDAARQFADGVDKAVGRLIGMAKKKTGGKANPKVVRDLLIRKLRGS